MALILNLETATRACSVAVSKDGEVLALKELVREQYSHSENITLFIESVMQEVGMPLAAIDTVAISKGPGSYTGLRIGTSTAKGICYALDKPLVAVGTLQGLCFVPTIENRKATAAPNTLLCPMIDARRMEVYAALYDLEGNVVRPVQADVVEATTYQQWLEAGPVLFFGDGAAKCKATIEHPNAIFIDDVAASAQGMAPCSEMAFNNSQLEDVAYFEPFYLKDFVATKPRKLL